MKIFTRSIEVLREEGPYELLKRGIPHIHNSYIAPLLPKTNASYNGVNVTTPPYFDTIAPGRQIDRPYYESGLVSGIQEYVRRGDHVVIVGGGWGVTAVKAAQNVENSGKLTVYEGSDKQVDRVQQTIKKNNTSDITEIVHGIVGPKISLLNKEKKATRISPEELPECDVLELDCEGAEVDILKNLAICPRVILVESHGMYDAPSSKIEELLNELSYSVKSKQVADRGSEEFCIKNDIYSLVAVQE